MLSRARDYPLVRKSRRHIVRVHCVVDAVFATVDAVVVNAAANSLIIPHNMLTAVAAATGQLAVVRYCVTSQKDSNVLITYA